MLFKTKLSGKQASFGHPRSQDAIGPGSPSPSACVTPCTVLRHYSALHSWQTSPFLLRLHAQAGWAFGGVLCSSRTSRTPAASRQHAPPTPPAPCPRGHSVTLSASAAAAVGCCASVEQAAMWSLRGLRLAAGETRVCGRQEGASPVGVSYLLLPCEDRSALASAGGWPRETLASGAPSRSSHLELLA